MRRWLAACLVLAVLAVMVEPVLGIHGHWPVGTAGLLGAGGSLLLALSAKTLGRAGLQKPDAGDSEASGP
jgi:hypothetical protein